MTQQEYIKEYCKIQHDGFCNYIKSIVEALDKVLDIKGDYALNEQQKITIRGIKAIYSGELVKAILDDLEKGEFTAETIETRVKLNKEVGAALIEAVNPNPVMKVIMELCLSDMLNERLFTLKNQQLWIAAIKSL